MLLSFITVILALLGRGSAQDPVVEVRSGRLLGRAVEFSHSDVAVQRTLHVFKGIPFAEPPVGDLRFRPPQPKEPWDGVYNATEFGSACIQPLDPTFPTLEPQNEDCLFLNIYAPQSSSDRLPVMVWIHGGGLVTGSGGYGYYDGTVLAAIGDVIVVSLNYRLGVFGFLATGDEHASGNYGLLDQVAALQWVQDNIAAFGGDADQVTIFGESAGSISCEYLTLSPMTNGLFHRVIMQSGSTTMDGYFTADTDMQSTIAHGLGKLVGCERDSSEELIQCLRGVSVEGLMSTASLRNVTGLGEKIRFIPFPPVLDGQFLTDEAPADTLRRKDFPKANIEFLIGTTADEGSYFVLSVLPDSVDATEVSMSREVYEAGFKYYLPPAMKANPAIVDAINLVYVDWGDVDSSDADYVEAFSQATGDQLFVCPTDLSARAYAESGATVYRYVMTHEPALPIYKISWMKVTHGEEIPFVFGWHFSDVMDWTMPPEDVQMTLDTIQYWVNFAKTGNPNEPDSGTGPTPQQWPLFQVPGLQYKKLSPTMRNGRAWKVRECALWNDFIPKQLAYTGGCYTSGSYEMKISVFVVYFSFLIIRVSSIF